MKLRQAIAHMQAAYIYASLSYCVRRQVGCVVVRDNRIISIGYNGTPAGEDNTCEAEDGSTKSCVIHAEDNALRKLERCGETAEGATLFVTTAPCKTCAEKIAAHNVSQVLYDDLYRNDDGIRYLQSVGIAIEQMTT
jgi:dCMP deaminase